MNQPNQSIQPKIPQDPQLEVSIKPSLPKWGLILIIIAGIIVIGTVGYGVYKFFNPQWSWPTGFCASDAQICSDGSTVDRVAPDCEFAECPEVIDPTADWQTYKSEYYGYEFKYPLSWDYAGDNDGGSFKRNNEIIARHPVWLRNINYGYQDTLEKAIAYQARDSYIDANKANQIRLEKIVDDDRTLGIISEWSVVTAYGSFSHYRADFENKTQKPEVNQYGTFKEAFSFSLEYGRDEFKHELDLIARSFKFIEIDPTANWQTYKNEEYGYEVKYPEEYTYKDLTQDFIEESKKSMGGGPLPVSFIVFGRSAFKADPDYVYNSDYGLEIRVYGGISTDIVLGIPISSDFTEFSHMNIDGLSWVKQEIISEKPEAIDVSGEISFGLDKDAMTFTIRIPKKVTQNPSEMEIIDQILSTFKFID